MMKRYYVGLDVHSKQNVFVIKDTAGKIVAQGEVLNGGKNGFH